MRAPLSRAEGSGHRRPASAPSLGRRETRARARPGECRHVAAPSGKASPASGARPHPGTLAQRAHPTSRLGWGAGRRGDPTRRTGGLQRGAGTEFRFFFFFFFKPVWVRESKIAAADIPGHPRRIGCPSRWGAWPISAPGPPRRSPVPGAARGWGSTGRLGPSRGSLGGALPAP